MRKMIGCAVVLGLAAVAAVFAPLSPRAAEAASVREQVAKELEAVNLRLWDSDAGITGTMCFPRTGYLGSINCDRSIRISYGYRLSDAGTQGLDGGQPLTATSNDDLFTFPEMSAKVDLPPTLQCLAFKFDDGDAGTCHVFQRTP